MRPWSCPGGSTVGARPSAALLRNQAKASTESRSLGLRVISRCTCNRGDRSCNRLLGRKRSPRSCSQWIYSGKSRFLSCIDHTLVGYLLARITASGGWSPRAAAPMRQDSNRSHILHSIGFFVVQQHPRSQVDWTFSRAVPQMTRGDPRLRQASRGRADIEDFSPYPNGVYVWHRHGA